MLTQRPGGFMVDWPDCASSCFILARVSENMVPFSVASPVKVTRDLSTRYVIAGESVKQRGGREEKSWRTIRAS